MVPRSPFLEFRPLRALLSLGIALVVVPVGAVVLKALVEGMTPLTYTIHWKETVPFIVLFTALLVNGSLNRRARRAAP